MTVNVALLPSGGTSPTRATVLFVEVHTFPELTLGSMRIERGRKLSVSGNASVDDRQKILEFYEALLKVEVRNQPLFAKGQLPDIRNQPGTQTAQWSFAAELKRTDATE